MSPFSVGLLSNLAASALLVGASLALAALVASARRHVFRAWHLPWLAPRLIPTNPRRKVALVLPAWGDEVETDQRRTACSEVLALHGVYAFFGSVLVRWVIGYELKPPEFRDRDDREQPEAEAVFVLGGPKCNGLAAAEIARLVEQHRLNYEFVQHRNRWSIRDRQRGTLYSREDDGSGSVTDYGVFIVAPGASYDAYICAGINSTGTRGAVHAALTPKQCSEILARLKDNNQRGRYFAALIRTLSSSKAGVPPAVSVVNAELLVDKPIVSDPH